MTEKMKKLFKESESWKWTLKMAKDLFITDNAMIINEPIIIEEDIIDDLIEESLDCIDINDIEMTTVMKYNLDIGRIVYRKVNELYEKREGWHYIQMLVDYKFSGGTY